MARMPKYFCFEPKFNYGSETFVEVSLDPIDWQELVKRETGAMNDYISREAALEAAMTYCPDDDGSCSKAGEDIRSLLDELESIPPADVRPVVRGRWLTNEYMYGDPDVGIADMWIDRRAESTDYYAFCSNCKGDAGFDGEEGLVLSNFCPNCGAQMGGDAE